LTPTAKPVFVHDKAGLEAFLLKHREVNFYHLGDLDDFFWPYTTWYALKEAGELAAVFLLFTALEIPILLGIDNDNQDQMQALLGSILSLLPHKFYALLSPGLEAILAGTYHLEPHGEHAMMVLKDPDKLAPVDTRTSRQLKDTDIDRLNALYKASYPGHWFTARMLETGQYFGIAVENNELVSVAGVHVYAPEYKIAALGNIVTHPAYRGQGLGTAVTAAVCNNLLKTVDLIGLTVESENQAAIHLYEKLGFEKVAPYYEFTFTRK
jgi:ribosomal protein S18 acetylase RimI-like enzyme